jgi:hypothetical protein
MAGERNTLLADWVVERGPVSSEGVGLGLLQLADIVVLKYYHREAVNAGLAVGMSERRLLEEAIAIDVTAASLSTRKRETIDSYPYRHEVDARVQEVRTRIVAC